jgi:hypothetical protein
MTSIYFHHLKRIELAYDITLLFVCLCYKPLLRNGCWRHSRLEEGLAGAVVIFKVWRLAIAL